MAAGRKENVKYRKTKLRKKLGEGETMAALSGVGDPKTSIFHVQGRGDLITHKVVKSNVFVLCPVSSNICTRDLQLHSSRLGLSARGAFTSHSLLPK